MDNSDYRLTDSHGASVEDHMEKTKENLKEKTMLNSFLT